MKFKNRVVLIVPMTVVLALAGCSEAESVARHKEIERLNAEVTRLTAENARLQVTEDGLWGRAVQADRTAKNVGDLEDARVLYQEFLDAVLARLDERVCFFSLDQLARSLESEDRKMVIALTEVAVDGSGLLLDTRNGKGQVIGKPRKVCASKAGLARLVTLHQVAVETLAKWPVDGGSPLAKPDRK